MRFNSAASLETSGGDIINIAPLIDMMFILLIFFVVSTSFVRETGVEVEKPTAASAEALAQQSIMIGITAGGDLHVGGRQVALLAVRGLVREELAGNPDKPVVIIADRRSSNGVLVDVIDECKLAGARKVSLATEQE